MDVTDKCPFHSTRWRFTSFENALNFSELRETRVKNTDLDICWDMSDINIIGGRNLEIPEKVGDIGLEGIIASVPVVMRTEIHGYFLLLD
jgi:hypothetical protein